MILDYVNTDHGYDLVDDNGNVLDSFMSKKLLADFVRDYIVFGQISDKLFNLVY